MGSSYFYPRPPRGGRHAAVDEMSNYEVFLSTPSARRATMMNFTKTLVVFYFYPRPPRGGRPVQRRWLLPSIPISIHALREEGDLRCRWPGLCTAVFLSTPSARRATISCIALDAFAMDFYPRPPRGGRQGDALFRQNGFLISIHALREEGDTHLCR